MALFCRETVPVRVRLQANMQPRQPMQRSGWATFKRRRFLGLGGEAALISWELRSVSPCAIPISSGLISSISGYAPRRVLLLDMVMQTIKMEHEVLFAFQLKYIEQVFSFRWAAEISRSFFIDAPSHPGAK
jgi:hypothetical protein